MIFSQSRHPHTGPLFKDSEKNTRKKVLYFILKAHFAFDIFKLCNMRSVTYMTMTIVCIGVSTPPQKHHRHLSCQPLLKSVNCSSPPFQAIPSSISVFCKLPPPHIKAGFFSERLKYQSFSSLTPSYFLKVTKLLVRISQFTQL